MRSRQGSRCHVATSPRRDVSTSRRHQVTTWRSTNTEVNHSPRRDINSKICISSLNARRLGIGGHQRTCGQRHEFGEPATLTLEYSGIFVLVFLIVLIIVGSHEDTFHIAYFVSFLHDVLNLFLGLHQTLSQTMD